MSYYILNTMFYAARNQSFWGGGLLAKWGSGSYDTTAHMKELAKLDKNIPAHLIGGQSDPKKPHYDFLSPKASGLEKELNGKFTKLTSFSGNSDHEGEIWNEAQNKYIIKPNVSIEDNNLSNLLDPAMKREAVRVNENQMQM